MRGANYGNLPEQMVEQPLPPRARGKLPPFEGPFGGGASTPACAGQTTATSRSRWSSSLYPRVRGANSEGGVFPSPLLPLPPRARGKLMAAFRPSVASASTPACAGQTHGRVQALGGERLYPRVRGANMTVNHEVDGGDPLPPRARGKLISRLVQG